MLRDVSPAYAQRGRVIVKAGHLDRVDERGVRLTTSKYNLRTLTGVAVHKRAVLIGGGKKETIPVAWRRAVSDQ